MIASLTAGCSEAIFSMVSFRNHYAYSDAAFVEYQMIQQKQGEVTKADVLATLGPPIHVIGQSEGDIFVYRRKAVDTRSIDINPSMVSFSVPIPIFFGSRTSGRDDTLMLFFDAEGHVRGEASRFDVEEPKPTASEIYEDGR